MLRFVSQIMELLTYVLSIAASAHPCPCPITCYNLTISEYSGHIVECQKEWGGDSSLINWDGIAYMTLHHGDLSTAIRAEKEVCHSKTVDFHQEVLYWLAIQLRTAKDVQNLLLLATFGYFLLYGASTTTPPSPMYLTGDVIW